MRLSPLPTLALAAALHPGCSNEPERCFVGDPNAAPVIEPVYRDATGELHALRSGDPVPLLLPPQGGRVMFVGVRAKNLDGCPLVISTALRDDTCGGAIVALERRPVTLEETDDGWLAPLRPAELENYSNLPACPRANLERDIHAQPHELLIEIEDKDGRRAETSLRIIPTCAEPEFLDRCLCECKASYSLGDECGPEIRDAGTSSTCASGDR